MPEVIVSEAANVQSPIGNELTISEQSHSTNEGGLVAYTVHTPALLDTIVDEWSDLAKDSSDPNPFYEPAFFQAATKHLRNNLGNKDDWRIVIVFEEKSKQLVGFFPFVLQRKYAVLQQLTLWNSPLNFLTTPLLRKGFEKEVFELLLTHIQSMKPHVDLIELQLNHAEGRVHQELHMLVRHHLLKVRIADHYSRAQLSFGSDYETYVKESVGGHHLRGYRRQLRRLNNLGQVEFRVGNAPHSAACWSQWFLDLEEQGWKGAEGTAMKQNSDEAAFFESLLAEGFEQQRVEMLGLFLDGEPIALGCTLLTNTGGFTYKITFDENYKKYSPGILLQLHLSERFLNDQGLLWLDSCAVPDHPMINRLWRERRSIQNLSISTGRPLGNLVLGCLPLARVLKRMLRKPGTKS